MYSFIDLHSHTLFGVDDGSKDFAMTKSMLKIAYDDGIRAICFTPHFKIYKFHSDEDVESYNETIVNNFNLITDFAKTEFPDLDLFLGNEIMFHSDISNSLISKKCRELSDGRYILVEFMPDVNGFDLKNSLTNLLRKGYRPILAHIERYDALTKHFSLLVELKELGVITQVNARTITKFKIGSSSAFPL